MPMAASAQCERKPARGGASRRRCRRAVCRRRRRCSVLPCPFGRIPCACTRSHCAVALLCGNSLPLQLPAVPGLRCEGAGPAAGGGGIAAHPHGPQPSAERAERHPASRVWWARGAAPPRQPRPRQQPAVGCGAAPACAAVQARMQGCTACGPELLGAPPAPPAAAARAGTIPDAWGQAGAFPALSLMALGFNQLTGELPPEPALPSLLIL